MVHVIHQVHTKNILLFLVLACLSLAAFFYIPSTTESVVLTIDEESLKQRILLWPGIVRAVQQAGPISDDPFSFEYLYFKDCWKDNDWLRMYSDVYCTFLWMRTLTHSPTHSIDRILAVITTVERQMGEESKSNQNGGMRCNFGDITQQLGVQGYWKPCDDAHLSSNSENYQSEIIAFHIDQILGFYRTPPVVPIYFTEDQLRALARQAAKRELDPDPLAMIKVQTVMDKCGSPNGAEGAMVGWSNWPIAIAAGVANMFGVRKENITKLVKTLDFSKDASFDAITWGLENVALNMFVVLTGNLQKFGHSVFVARKEPNLRSEHGPLLFIDNDRSSWDYDLFKRGVVRQDNPLTSLCKFPLEISKRILAFNHTSTFTLGNIIYDALSVYKSETPMFTKTNIYYLDQRVEYLQGIITNCIQRHGVENVLFPEPWLASKSYDLVEHFVNIFSAV